MKRNTFVLIGLYLIFYYGGLKAQVVSQETARQVADNFFYSQFPLKSLEHMDVLPLGNKRQPTMYAFSLSSHWVLVAGDKRVQPILAYSDDNSNGFPDEENMPVGMAYMLDWYIELIESMRNVSNVRDVNPQWELYTNANNRSLTNRSIVVGPLLTRNGDENLWKQGWNNGDFAYDTTKYYNKFCPIIPGCIHHRAVVGCVAVALAQVMWYWKWPYAAIMNTGNGDIVHRYNWDAMPAKIYDSTNVYKVDMVAILLRDCGASVNMNYGCDISSASPSYLSFALRNIFGYNADNLIYRSSYSDSEWLSMMKNELNLLRPILYGGQNQGGGHRFVIDGYDSENLFHVNFGLGGGGNGYYTINDVVYNNNQSMVINVSPDYPLCTSIDISASDIWNTNFITQNGGAISIGNRTITTGMHGYILSGESVTLTSGFEIQAGADVYIDIKDMHCNDRCYLKEQQDNQKCSSMPQKVSNVDNVPIVSKLFRDGQILIHRDGKTYTISGQRIK